MSSQIRERRFERPALYLAPALTILAGIAMLPLIYVFWLSLQRRMPIFDISRFAGLENYQFLLTDQRFYRALFNTVYFTVISVGLEFLLGLGIAILLNRTFAGKGLVRSIILVPWAVPTVVSAKMWEWIFNSDFGIFNYLLGADINWLGNPKWAIHAAIFADVWKTTPFVTLLLMAGLQSIPHELYSAAQIDGATPWTIFKRITLPLLKPLILVILTFRTLDAFRVFDVIYVLTGGGPANTTETISIYSYRVLFQTLQFGYGSTLAVTTFLLVGLITVVYIRMLGKERA
jgi:multiple sugar transport system permease protein